MKKKKICFIAQFPPPIHGLSKAVETVYNSYMNSEVDPEGRFIFSKIDLTNNKNLFRIIKDLIKTEADVFYFTISQSVGGNLRDLIILYLLKLLKKDCIIHLHGGYYRILVEKDMNAIQRYANYQAIKNLKGAIVLSDSLRSIFKGMIQDDKILVVNNCIDNEFLPSESAIAEKLNASSYREVIHVLFLSNFIKTKGYPILLSLAKKEKEYVDCGGIRRLHFDFAGKFFDKDEEQDFWNFISSNNLENYVTYHGVVSGETKKKLLASCDIFSLLTRYPKEGQPISILEAMGNALYIVTTNHAGIPDVVTDTINGIVIKEEDENYLFCRLHEISNDDLRRVGKINRDKCVTEYTEKKYLKALENIFINT